MLDKDKNCIEFSMRSMTISHRPYQEDTEIDITGMIPGREIFTENNPFDIPCEVVMVPKREFERLQTENEELKKKLAEFEPVPGYREFLTALYPGDDVEKLVQITERIFSQDRWKFWKDNYEALSKLVGFSSVEEIEDYLVNEAEADTLYEAISKLHDQVKYTCDEWKDMKKKLEECEKDYISERDRAEALEKEIGIYSRTLKEWKEGTGCPSPSAAKTLIGSGMSWYHAYNEIKKANEKLADDVKSWQNVTGYSTPEDFLSAKINKVFKGVSSWEEITGFSTPEKCSSYIDTLEKKLEDIKDLIEED